MPDPYRLLQYLLADPDGSLADAVDTLGLSRDEIGALAEVARARGINIDDTGAGLRLASSDLSLYDRANVRRAIDGVAPGTLARLDLLTEVDSTNAYLAAGGAAFAAPTVCLAEFQTAGRGRRGRVWQGTYGASVLASIYWRFPQATSLEGLSLCVGVAVIRALQALGASHLALKWPNDVYGNGAKLAGILIESASRSGGWDTVTGIGLNVSENPDMFSSVEQAWTSLNRLLPEPKARDAIAGCLIGHVLQGLSDYAVTGLAPVHAAWPEVDLTAGCKVRVTSGTHTAIGVARGIDARGALRVETEQGVQAFHSAEVSLRLDGEA